MAQVSPGFGFFFRAALRALCVRALAPTRKTISATSGALAHTSNGVLLGGLRCGSSNREIGVLSELRSNRGIAYLFAYLDTGCGL